jgi:hypothetical protein
MTKTVIASPFMDDDGENHGEVERRRKPFVPSPDRIVPVDPELSARYARDKFKAEISILVGAQLTEQIVRYSGDLEDKIRERARDDAHYGILSQVHYSFVVRAARLRDRFMDGDGEAPGFQQ